MQESLKLGVNVDHVATLRQVRHSGYPSPLEAARLCVEAGAHSITVHLREDRRHIQDHDVWDIRRAQGLPLNLEMAISPEIVRFALEVCPDEVCLVPERRAELTTEGGLDVISHRSAIQEAVDPLMDAGIVVSLFVDPDPAQLDASVTLGVPYVELHTGAFCDASDAEKPALLEQLQQAAYYASRLGLRVNAGHGIHRGNLPDILKIPALETLNIGHSIVSRALFVGMKEAVRELLEPMSGYGR